MATKPYTRGDRHEMALSALEDMMLEQLISGERKEKPDVHEYISIPDNKKEFTQWELYHAVFAALENTCPTY